MTSRLVRGTTIAAISLAGIFSAGGVASAKGGGGGGGGGTPAPAPAPAPAPTSQLDCYNDPAIVAQSAENVAVNAAGDAGCVGVDYSSGLRIAFVAVNPGWGYSVASNGSGTNQRVQITFTQAATGRSIDFRYELGKTRIG